MNITIRNIPESVINKIRTLSKQERRSLNNEILFVLERGIERESRNFIISNKNVNREVQVEIWKKLAGTWEDERSTSEIIDDIFNSRTAGREYSL